MHKIKVRVGDHWEWLWGRIMDHPTVANKMQTTLNKSAALPSRACDKHDDLQWAKKLWPECEFKLTKTL